MKRFAIGLLLCWMFAAGCGGMDINTKITPQFGCGCQRPMKPQPAQQPARTKKGQHE